MDVHIHKFCHEAFNKNPVLPTGIMGFGHPIQCLSYELLQKLRRVVELPQPFEHIKNPVLPTGIWPSYARRRLWNQVRDFFGVVIDSRAVGRSEPRLGM